MEEMMSHVGGGVVAVGAWESSGDVVRLEMGAALNDGISDGTIADVVRQDGLPPGWLAAMRWR